MRKAQITKEERAISSWWKQDTHNGRKKTNYYKIWNILQSRSENRQKKKTRHITSLYSQQLLLSAVICTSSFKAVNAFWGTSKTTNFGVYTRSDPILLSIQKHLNCSTYSYIFLQVLYSLGACECPCLGSGYFLFFFFFVFLRFNSTMLHIQIKMSQMVVFTVFDGQGTRLNGTPHVPQSTMGF